jgi:phosphopentomutase
MYRRIAVIVLDSVGIGEAPDASAFGDRGAHTLGHICERNPGIQLPNLAALGLGNIAPLSHVPAIDQPRAWYGKMQETSVGKDTMTGHWELMGLHVKVPFPTYANGFPTELIHEFERQTGRKVLCNQPASGTTVLDEFGAEQMRTGAWIVYTSADSVFQIAAHEDVIPLEELYRACKIARELTMRPEWSVGRVIARPYVGEPGAFTRTPHRHDYAVSPPQPTVLDAVKAAGKSVVAVGKIHDIFNAQGITEWVGTGSNAEGIEQTIAYLAKPFEGVLFTNLVDFDSLYGHRRDPQGYAQALEQFDRALPAILAKLTDDDLLIITADHGNDPTHHGTDHTREYVPVLCVDKTGRGGDVGVRGTFADLGATILANFNLPNSTLGTSMLGDFN